MNVDDIPALYEKIKKYREIKNAAHSVVLVDSDGNKFFMEKAISDKVKKEIENFYAEKINAIYSFIKKLEDSIKDIEFPKNL